MNDFYEIMIAAPPLDKKTPDGPRTYGVLSFLASNVWKFHGTSPTEFSTCKYAVFGERKWECLK